MRRTCFLMAALAVAMFVGSAQAGTVAHYNFDSDYTDSSGNNLHGTPTSGVSITTTAGETVFGGGAADFTAARDWVAIPQQLIGSGNEYSLSFWARDTSTSGGGMVMGVSEGDSAAGFFVWLYKPGPYINWRGSTNTGSDGPRNASFPYTDPDSDWHHYALIAGDYDGEGTVNDITLYRDGDFVESESDKLTGFIIETIGSAYGTNIDFDWEGQLDEVWIFDNALTASEVSGLYRNNAVPEPTSLGLLLCGLLALAGLRTSKR